MSHRKIRIKRFHQILKSVLKTKSIFRKNITFKRLIREARQKCQNIDATDTYIEKGMDDDFIEINVRNNR